MRIHPIDLALYWSLRLAHAMRAKDNDLRGLIATDVSSILVISSTAIGDTLLSTPAIRALRLAYPAAKIVALLNRDNLELFETNPDIDVVIPYHGGYHHFLSTVIKLRAYHPHLAVILHGNEPQATPFAYLSGACFIVKLPNKNHFRFLLSNREPVVGWDAFGHGLEQRLQCAALAGAPSTDTRMVLPVGENSPREAARFLKNCGLDDDTLLIGFQVGASSLSRMWFAERFVALGKKLLTQYPHCAFIVTGSPAEQPLCNTIAAQIGGRAFVSAGHLALKDLPALVSRLNVLVSGDTGIMHLAVAVGTPVVALFAMADAKHSGPAYDLDKHFVIQKWRTCVPCVGKKCTYQLCMENIAVDEVVAGVAHVLSKVEPETRPVSRSLAP
jgi:ADP-heptose:LPS heptosyltransferase